LGHFPVEHQQVELFIKVVFGVEKPTSADQQTTQNPPAFQKGCPGCRLPGAGLN
jgi:hypothetical protein